MDAMPEAVWPGSVPNRRPQTVLRICYVDGCGGAPGAAFAAAASQGFSHVMLPPPWRVRAGGDRYLATDFGALAGDLGGGSLSTVAAQAAGAGVGLLLDVVLDRLDATSALLAQAGCPFAAPDQAIFLDPRRNTAGGAALAHLADPGEALVLATWWAERLRGWHKEGVAGFRLLGLGSIPAMLLAPFFTALREKLADVLLLPWTPGLTREATLQLRGLGADAVFCSLPWWDWQADWLWDELADLARIAPVLGLDGVPPGPAHQNLVAAEARCVALAPVLGQGWMHVAGDDAGHTEAIRAANGLLAERGVFARPGVPGLPAGVGGQVLAVLRTDAADHRSANAAILSVINGDPVRRAVLSGSNLLPACGGVFASFAQVGDDVAARGEPVRLDPQSRLELAPGQALYFAATGARPGQPAARRADARSARDAAAAPRLAIENPSPAVDQGAFPVKAIVGELVTVEADIVFDGHDKIAAALSWQSPGDGGAGEVRMTPLGNDRWQARFPLTALGLHSYVITAWRDRFETFRDELAKKSAAGVKIDLELIEGEALLRAAADRGSAGEVVATLERLDAADQPEKLRLMLSPDLAAAMAAADDRPFAVQTQKLPVEAERIEARFASWYEVFPRSLSDDPERHGTFADVERHLPRIRAMGFDVLYFPPISPIGRTNRKGRNNTLTPAPDDPGSPYAVGSPEGGHDALHPQLGTLEDFARLRAAAAAHGLELALDFAIQCSPDHPWLKQHPGWFDWRPDGSIRYAENPPKKYEDIVNVDFYAKDAVPELWMALCDVVLFWASQGIRLFRVDNPHTKPLPFWHWMIAEVRRTYPDAIFLAEAFTRPKVMYRLAKVGFSQSYTYFTWRNAKRELQEYLTELNGPPRDFFRPHFFVNTPDINPVFLQTSGRPGFLIRAALAATLSGLWGVYNGFELCEAAAVTGKEEYLDSEKYQLRAWDWDRAGNIVAEITALNRIRRQNPALQSHTGVTFHTAANDAIIYYEKATPDRSNVVLVAVSLDPFAAQEADFEIPFWSWALPDGASMQAVDLMTGESFVWHGKMQHLRLTPDRPFAIWRVRPTL
jgi:starch synthase (maltosyl-transferring)